jgi:hypothetical protein
MGFASTSSSSPPTSLPSSDVPLSPIDGVSILPVDYSSNPTSPHPDSPAATTTDAVSGSGGGDENRTSEAGAAPTAPAESEFGVRSSDRYFPLSTATLKTSVFDVVHIFSERGISAVPIIDEDGVVLNMYETVDIVVRTVLSSLLR